jgi:transcriptional regulatory protein RtcR
MATLCAGGRIGKKDVAEEIERLEQRWRPSEQTESTAELVSRYLGEHAAAELDRFDRVQLADVLAVCEQVNTLADAGKRLFAVSRAAKKSHNDSDRIRQILGRGLVWTMPISSTEERPKPTERQQPAER